MDARSAAAAGIDACIAAQASAAQPILLRIRAIVREEAPHAEEAISHRMPAFMLHGALLYFAAVKQHIGIYPLVHGDAPPRRALAPCRGKQGSLSVPLTEAVPYELIRRGARQRVQENVSNALRRRTK